MLRGNKSKLMVYGLGILFSLSEQLYRYAFQQLEITKLSELILFFEVNELLIIGGFWLLVLSLVFSFAIRFLLVVPYGKLPAKQAIPAYRLTILISASAIGYFILRENPSIYTIIGFVFACMSLYLLETSRSLDSNLNPDILT